MSWISKLLYRKESDSPKDDGESKQVASRVRKSDASISPDNPIQNPKDDALGRDKPARSFAEQVLSIDTTEGVVVGVLGPWGSGKTSFVNLARGYLKDSDITVLDFNPWMFSGAEQLVEAFFVEISAQLKVRAGFAEC